MDTCPSLSPETQTPCSLVDRRSAHRAGHESVIVDSVRSSWATTPEERERWDLASTYTDHEGIPRCSDCGGVSAHGVHDSRCYPEEG